MPEHSYDNYMCILFQPHPTISMGPSTNKQYDPLAELDALDPPAGGAKPAGETKKTSDKQSEKKNANSGGSWFGGFFSKLALKPKNQMILPDDNNPTVKIYNHQIYEFLLYNLRCRLYGMPFIKSGRTKTRTEKEALGH